MKDLTKAGDKNPGRLKVAEEAVARSQALVERGEAQLAQLERDRESLVLARERRSDAEKALSERRALLEKARQAERLTAERDAASERFERYRQAVQISEELTKLHASHPSPTPVSVLRRTVERLRQLDTQITTLRAMLAGEVEVKFDVPPEPTWRPLSRWAFALVGLGLVLAVLGFVAKLDVAGLPIVGGLSGLGLGNAPGYLGVVAAGIGFILAFVAWWLRRTSIAETQLRDVEIDRRLRGRSQLEQELREAEAESAAQLEVLGSR